MSIPIRNVYFLLLYAWNHVGEGEEALVGAEDFTRLQDLYAHVLVETTVRILSRGLDRGYVPIEDSIAGVRGKLDLSSTLKQNLLSSARTFCRYDEFHYDVPHNRILKSTLRRLLGVDLDEGLRSRIRKLHGKLDAVSEISISSLDFRLVQLHRQNRIYDFALRVCRLIHDSLIVEPHTGQTKFRDIRQDDRSMAQLFEAFVFNFFRREQTAFAVSRPHIQWYDAKGTDRDLAHLPIMRTDVLLDRPDRTIVMDTKYYREALRGRFEGRKLHSGHLYQIYAYIENRSAVMPGRSHEGLLLYPVVEAPFSFSYVLNGRKILIRSVNLDQHWTQIHHELLALLDDIPPSASASAMSGWPKDNLDLN